MELPKLGEAAQAAYEAEERLAKLNALVKEARREKVEKRAMVDALLEDAGIEGVPVDTGDGRRVTYYYVHKAHFDIHDEEAVREWAEEEDENFIDPTPSLREKLIFEECRRRDEEGLPLPPGITKRSEKELHKSTR